MNAGTAAAATKAPVLLPPPGKVRSWALSPHIDLQMQVPPQMLLQKAVMVASPGAPGPRPPQQRRHNAAAQDRASSGVSESAIQQAPGFRRLSEALELVQEAVQQEGGIDPADVAKLQHEDVGQQFSRAWEAGLHGEALTQTVAADLVNAVPDARSTQPVADASVAQAAAAAAAAGVEACMVEAVAAAEDAGEVPQRLGEVAAGLAMRCLIEEVVWGDQQALPLQALQLITAIWQLERAAAAACAAGFCEV